ncbi:MAG: hypothetical protein WC824_06045, partial [Bacteroidota bacterium]
YVGENPVLNSLSLPAFSILFGELYVTDTLCTSLSFPLLETIGGNCSIQNNTLISSLDFSSLTEVSAGDVDIGPNAALVTLDLALLETANGNLLIHDNAALLSLDLSSVTSVGGILTVGNNALLASVDLGALVSTGESLNFTTNPSLSSVDLGALTSVATSSGQLYFSTHAVFTTTTLGTPPLPSLISVGPTNEGDVDFLDNLTLTDAVAASVGDALTLAGWTGVGTYTGNE